MMEYWWLYLLVFMFGYMTHKTFYFFRSVKISIGLIRVSQLVSLGVLAKSIEENKHFVQQLLTQDNND